VELMTVAMAPFSIDPSTMGGWLIFLLLGVGFGATLEMAGFSYAPNLAAQFYGRDMRVLKTMFSAIVTAMILIFLSSAVGALDFRMVDVATTYLWPGIVGGLIMGAGFVIGGFCPGTSLAAAATGSRDALVYLAGLIVGIFGFGETVTWFEGFYNSSDLGRFTIPEWLGIFTGVVVLIVVVMASGVFLLVERIEHRLGSRAMRTPRRLALGLAGAAAALVLVTLIAQQPGWEDHWEMVAADEQVLLDNHDVQIHPGELLTLIHADAHIVMLDVQQQTSFDAFHIEGARYEGSDLETLYSDVADLMAEPPGTIYVTVGEDEQLATDAWRLLKGEHIPNVYVLEGGTSGWVDTFGSVADPDPAKYTLDYEHKITEVAEPTAPPAASGGCG
jgi:hypothetical protein